MSLDTEEVHGLGKILGESNRDYHAANALSHSKLEVFRRRPALYKRKYVDKAVTEEYDPTKYALGIGLHSALEGPEAWNLTVAVCKFDNFRTNAAREFRDACALDGKVIITGDHNAIIDNCIVALGANASAIGLTVGAQSEVTWRFTHPRIPVPLQCRTDLYKPGHPVDLKTTASLDAGDFINFERSFWKLGYHRQAAWYKMVLERCGEKIEDFHFIAVETQEPFGVVVYRVSDDAMRIGDEENARDLADLVECYRTGIWPNKPQDVQEISVPDWYAQRHEIT